jgi:hypothetical protein
MQQADVVLLGEFHDDPVAHALQLELLKRAAKALGYQLPTPKAPMPPAPAPAAASKADDGSSRQQARKASPAAPHAAVHTQLQLQQQQQGVAKRLPLRPLVLSLEMFERDVQPVLDEYLAGSASLADLMRDARPWPNYRCGELDLSKFLFVYRPVKMPVVYSVLGDTGQSLVLLIIECAMCLCNPPRRLM